jgi:glycosyltransferase involved in cell wall biosynthesis
VSAPGPRIRVSFDATPLLGRRTGIGVYVENLLAMLAEHEDLAIRAAAFSVRRRAALRALPPGVAVARRPVPARLLQRAWLRADVPPAEWVMGRCDVVHGTNFVLPPPRKAAGVVTVHDLSFLHYPKLVDAASLAYRDLVPRATERAAAVLTHTHAMAEEIADAYPVAADRLVVTPPGVDAAWFTPPGRPPGLPAEYLIAVGTLEPRKGLDVFLSAYRQLLAETAMPPIVLVGAAGWGPALDTAGIPAEQVILPGYVDQTQLRALVAGALALVYPTRYEGFGLPPLEALAAGTPVLASNIPAVREAVGGHARLVPSGDVPALAAAIAAVLAAPPTPAQAAAARAHAAGFTWRRCAELTADAYRRVAVRSG